MIYPATDLNYDSVPDTGNNAASRTGFIKAAGLVFGEIGTSPIYTLSAIFLLPPATPSNIFGIISLIWTLITLVFVEYTYLAMGLSRKGEGGTIVMREILVPLLKSGNQVAFVSLITIFGVSLMIGDGVITPAITILSAVEGIRPIPGFELTKTIVLILIASLITIFLFTFQKKGSDKVARAFGPIMAVWFTVLAVSGLVSLTTDLSILTVINPMVGLTFLAGNGFAGFIILSSVFLCATEVKRSMPTWDILAGNRSSVHGILYSLHLSSITWGRECSCSTMTGRQMSFLRWCMHSPPSSIFPFSSCPSPQR